MKATKLLSLLFCTLITGTINVYACTDIIVGRKASVDGSVITSHTDAAPECRVHIIYGQKFKIGDLAPVYYGLQDVDKPLHEYGKIIGYIPQVAETYTYFHSGYSHINEFQLAIGESTLSQKKELQVSIETGKQIMTIEQAQAFALQRCKTARVAIKLITSLVEKYGFQTSCGPESEALCIADPNEAWVLEVFSVGTNWDPESGKPGAIWAAQRVPDDHIAIVPNWSIIKEIDLSKPDEFMASSNYQQVAIDHGWWNPKSGKPFIWQEVYTPVPREWAVSRLWLFYSKYAPNLKDWPDKKAQTVYAGSDSYHQYIEPLSMFPFSVKPEKKLSVQDVIAFQRELYEGTIYDMTNDRNWMVAGPDGKYVKSPLTTPFPTKAQRELLDITYRRMVSRGGYGMVAQLRNWLPNDIGGVYWYYVDNQYVSTYIPIYAGAMDVSSYIYTYDLNNYDEKSLRWAVDFVDNLLGLRWQDAVKDLHAARNPLEQSFFDDQSKIEKEAFEIYQKNPKKAKQYLTDYSNSKVEQTMAMYEKLKRTLISKYTNNNQGL